MTKLMCRTKEWETKIVVHREEHSKRSSQQRQQKQYHQDNFCEYICGVCTSERARALTQSTRRHKRWNGKRIAREIAFRWCWWSSTEKKGDREANNKQMEATEKNTRSNEKATEDRKEGTDEKKLVFKFGSIVRMLSFLSIDDDVDCSVISLNTQINRCYRHGIDG